MQQVAADRTSWPPGNGEMAKRMRAHDWAATPLGPIDTWPAELKSAAALVLDSGFPAALIWGPDLVTIYNDAFRPILGDKPEALGRSFAEIWSEAWHEIGPIAERALAGQSTSIEDYPLVINRSGKPEQAYFTFSYSPVRAADGSVLGMIDTVVETTRKVRAEVALRASEERMRLAMQSAGFYLWEIDVATGKVTFSENVDEVTGFATDQQSPDLMTRIAELIAPEERDRQREATLRAMRGEAEFHEVTRVINPDSGEPIWLEEHGTLINSPDGTPQRLVGVGMNITDRKRAEAALRESEERFRLIVESARNYAILITDPQDRITDWFAGAAFVFGWSAEEIIGQPGSILFTEQDREAGEPEREIETARTKGFAQDVRWHLRKDGRQVFIEGSVAALRRPDGSLQGFLKIGQDTTERQAYEQTLRASERHAKLLLAELQHRVRNTLGVIRSIARRTAATSATPEDYAMHLEGRIDAFARVQAAVTRNPLAGVDLEILVADELRAVTAHEGEQVKSISGPAMRLQPKPAETFALAIHELATNAVKYGALSIPEGRIAVTWTIDRSGDEPRLVFQWIETRVRLSSDKSRRRGFGTELIERTLGYELGSEAELDFTPHGLHCTITLPLDDHLFILDRERRNHVQ
ncbi:hypothetical protein DC522_09240 [Microvirga sp. KLBC 81]|uniref:PAS domain-containing sensor histidine kinase n=1 Tax=Microvirga sp. KLBC 81 TaxID=1862707 RepID=UPI000D50AED3|nr:PAS domain S-box protein [Microvirga sp. KLBC 81]PVE24787.1 hypothetical protein DC522_09240 [Microvirga sp. KLBC 81]